MCSCLTFSDLSVVDCFDLGFFNFSKFCAALQLFCQDIYNRTWPTLMADRMSHQIEKLKHCEMGIVAFDDEFRKTHREVPLIRVVQGTLLVASVQDTDLLRL